MDNDDHTQDDDTMDMAVSSSNTSGDCPDGGGDTGLMSPITQLSSTRMNNTDDDEDGNTCYQLNITLGRNSLLVACCVRCLA